MKRQLELSKDASAAIEELLAEMDEGFNDESPDLPKTNPVALRPGAAFVYFAKKQTLFWHKFFQILLKNEKSWVLIQITVKLRAGAPFSPLKWKFSFLPMKPNGIG